MSSSSLFAPAGWTLRARRRAAWAVPVVVAGVVAVAAVAPSAFAGNPHPALPARSAQQLVAAVLGSHVPALSGTVSSTPDLGLPQLPGSDGGDQLTTFLTEPSTWQLSIDGQDRQRLNLIGTGQETDLIHDGSTVWTWDSSSQAATHYDFAGTRAAAQSPSIEHTETAVSPVADARQLLRHLSSSTGVGVGPTTVVAGRSAYTLVLTPRSTATLIGRVVIDVDSATGLPLGVQFFPRGSSVAGLGQQFSSLHIGAPAASTFDFTPPAGAHVTTHQETAEYRGGTSSPSPDRAGAARPALLGEGWRAVVELPASLAVGADGLQPTADGGGHSAAGILAAATDPVTTGRVLQTRLVSVLFERDGRVLVGAVPATQLEKLAAAGK